MSRLATKIEQRALDELVPYARNARTHSPGQVEQIARSISEFGFTNPVLVDGDGGIIAGHGRVLAAQTLGMTSVPTLRVDWLTESQRRAYILADNQLALQADWDEDLLASELRDLRGDGFDLALTGFLDDEIEELLRPGGGAEGGDADACPEPSDRAVTETGDVWLLGSHRLICGDCTQREVLAVLMRETVAHVVWTDPPYNVAYSGKASALLSGENGDRTKILNDDLSDAEFRSFISAFYRSVWQVMERGAAIYVAHSETERATFTSEFLNAGFKLSGVVIWKKNSLVLGRSDYQWIHEPILYGWKPGAKHRWYGGRKMTTVAELGDDHPFVRRADGKWEVHLGSGVFVVDGQATVEQALPTVIYEEKPRRSDLHPTMKPVALVERFLRNHARQTDIVLDPFGGSGSTLMAAERLGVRAHLCELSPSFCDVIVRRWQQYTGKRAIHERSGNRFPED